MSFVFLCGRCCWGSCLVLELGDVGVATVESWLLGYLLVVLYFLVRLPFQSRLRSGSCE